jgi:hypothetical protein
VRPATATRSPSEPPDKTGRERLSNPAFFAVSAWGMQLESTRSTQQRDLGRRRGGYTGVPLGALHVL